MRSETVVYLYFPDIEKALQEYVTKTFPQFSPQDWIITMPNTLKRFEDLSFKLETIHG